jgi:hypothetical protein
MSPLKSILVGDRRRASALAPSCALARTALLLALTFAARAAAAEPPAGARAIRVGDARKAEKVLGTLRLLHEAAEADDATAFQALASKSYPDLFVKVAELSPGDLNTDLSTAVFLAEKLGRTWSSKGAATADCRGERPDIYLPLCLDLRGGTVRQLLLAKSRLHARWAAALLRAYSGEADAETARSLSEMAAARANDLLIASHVAETLKTFESRSPLATSATSRGERYDAPTTGLDESDREFADTLRAAGELLDWMPRSTTFYRLDGARLAYADGLFLSRKVRQTKRLVVSAANAYAPDPLKDLRLDAAQVSATVEANWRAAVRQTRLAEESLLPPMPSGFPLSR